MNLREIMALCESDFLAPDVGTIFDYHGSRYRVDGWLKERNPPAPSRDPVSQMINDILYQSQQEIGPKKQKLRWCFRKDATHVAGSGVAGCVAPIEDIKVVGRVKWSEKDFDEARAQANRFAANASQVF